ncbi:MAG: valine--tRNA ligase [Candidatus Xenobiia bacterium LiM19]
MNPTERQELTKVYAPQDIENKWYEIWIKDNLFHAEPSSSKKPYCIVIPPPNITGSLHLGHALDNTIQDILIRGKRMQGFEALWIPGTDHAGIATQNVVEKDLAKEKLSRHELGRKSFVERVWKWKEEYGSTIINQLKRLGVSCDWSRLRFTLDEQCSKAVREAFMRLYRKGRIYKGQRIINWCPRCLTALSDLEVKHEEHPSRLYYLRYPGSDGPWGITIATTRPETIIADTAVCVHPDDERYRHLIGKKVLLPLVGRSLPVISDTAVDPKFGTGALKITPAHDPVDFEIGKRHDLPAIVAMDEKGIMNEEAGRYRSLDRLVCREKILVDLREGGYLEKEEEYLHGVGHCYRCHTVIEPCLSLQWFVSMKELAEPAIAAVKEGKVRFIPEKYLKTYLYWMENIRDWCISRQLWWGHRIPVWTCTECGYMDAFLENPEGCPTCHSPRMAQEEDVLDTWFSSGLWPISTMGWPEETADLRYFYPTSVLVTGRDIIFLWVARMIMMGLEFNGDVPFNDVYIHATILDKNGRIMSKSKGTGVDPLVLIDRYGADATRFALVYLTSQGQDIRFSEARFEMSRNFTNKIWNAARFCLTYLPAGMQVPEKWSSLELSRSDRWIVSRLNRVILKVTEAFDNYAFDIMSIALYDFFWDDFCDWYIESVKPILQDESRKKEHICIQAVIAFTFNKFLRLLHPLMPFITEELWHLFNADGESISRLSWPSSKSSMVDLKNEEEFESLFAIIKGIRSLRNDLGLPPRKKTKVLIHTEHSGFRSLLIEEGELVRNLGALSELMVVAEKEKPPERALSTVVETHQIFIPIEEVEDITRLIERMEKELGTVETELEAIRRKFSNEAFVKNAPQHIIDAEKAREQASLTHHKKLELHLEVLKRSLH